MKSAQFVIATFLVLSVTSQTSSQTFTAGFGVGLSNADMSGFKDLNKSILNSLPFAARQIEDFPSALEYNFEINAAVVKKYYLGLVYNFFSTGSRISSKDYSGEYRFDIIASNYSIGLMNRLPAFESESFLCQITAALGYNHSKYACTEKLSVYSLQDNSNDYLFKSNGLFLKPGVNFLYTVKFLRFGLYASYYINTQNDIHLDENKSAKLTDPETGDQVKSAWNGLSYGLNFQFLFP